MKSNGIEIQLGKASLLSGPVILLKPSLIQRLGGIAEALTYQQIRYSSKPIAHDGLEIRGVHASYSNLAQMLPYTRRWLIEMVRELEVLGAIKVLATGGRNLLVLNEAFECEALVDASAGMAVFPALVRRVGLLEAVALQQIHIRCKGYDGSVWMLRSFSEMHEGFLGFVSIPTIKRLFARLRKAGLIYVVPYYRPERGSTVNGYRVNYEKLAEVLGIPVPVSVKPASTKAAMTWTDPVNPVAPVSSKASGSFMH